MREKGNAARARPLRRLVLSVAHLDAAGRGALAAGEEGDTAFRELSQLRRGGPAATWRALRDLGADEVLVTGSDLELEVFRDLLALLARMVPARSRLSARRDGSLEELAESLLGCLLRLPVSVARGGAALVRNLSQARRLASRAGSAATGVDPTRCLYLRPTLMFGLPVGGSVGHVSGVVNALARAGTRTTVLALWPQPQVDRTVEQVTVLPDFRSSYPNELNQHLYQRCYTRAALDVARRVRPGFLYERYTLNCLAGAQLRADLRLPLVLEFNGSEVWVQRHWGRPLRFEAVSERIERTALKSADLVVAVSDEVARQARAAGVAEERVLTYPNCVDAGVFDPGRFTDKDRERVRGTLGVPPGADLVTFVGTFGQWHGADVLATAIRRLADSRREWLEARRVHFLLVGDGQQAPRVREILGPGLGAPFVTLAGLRPQGETPGILAASDILLSPHAPNADGSPFFGSPTKLFEYMAMERLIVASDLDQIGLVLRGWRPGDPPPGREGGPPAAILADPGSVEDLVRALTRAVETPATERRRLGSEARRIVLASYTWDRNVAEVLRRLREVTGPHASAEPIVHPDF